MTDARASMTRRALLRLQAVLLATGVIALGGCLAVSVGVARTAGAAADRSIPATRAAYDAQAAMRSAHWAAVDNLTSVTTLHDPGSEYRHQITLAAQFLAVVAERNAAGAAGSGVIQAIQALLSTYVGLIGTAATTLAGAPGRDTTLGLAALLDATALLDDIVTRLGRLRDRQDNALRAQATSGWGHPAATAVWLFPVAALVTLLVVAQVELRRRFRRSLCPPLLVATVLAAVLGAATGWSTRTAGDLDTGWHRADRLGTTREAQLAALRQQGFDRLHPRVAEVCAGTCERTLDRLPVGSAGGSDHAGAAEAASTALGAIAAEAADDAATGGTINTLLPIVALAVMALVLAGFRPRLDEYRYRPT